MAQRAKAGSLYKQAKSPYWWVKFYIPGQVKPIRESTGTTNADEAQRFLHRRLGEVATGAFVSLEPERVKVNELLAMLEEDYENNGRGSAKQLQSRLKQHLRPFFGQLKAATVGTRQISGYITKRKKAGAKNATINRELEHLRRAFKLGFDAEPQLVLKPLKFKKLTEDNVREGLIDHNQYLALRAGLPEPYRTFFVCAYHLGTRLGELGKIQWSEVDFDRNEIIMKRYNTKAKKPRVLPIYGDMGEFLAMAKEVRDAESPLCPWVFQRKGKRFVFANKVWKNRVKKLGVEGLLFHDLRRTALTNMIEAGFSEKEAMEISGHTTDRTFRRYHIIRRHRIQTLGQRMNEFYKNAEEELKRTAENAEITASTGHTSGIPVGILLSETKPN
jgi:integrase